MFFMNGQQIYDNFQQSAGPDGLTGGAAIVNEVAAEYETRAQQIRAVMTRMESAWQGDAAGAAERGAGPMASEHEDSGPALSTAQNLGIRQADAYTDAKNSVLPVPPKPDLSNPMTMLTGAVPAPYEDQLDEHNAAAQNNVDVMNRYEGASGNNVNELPTNYGTLIDDEAGIGIGQDPGGGAIDSDDYIDTSGDDSRNDESPAPGPDGEGIDGSVSSSGNPEAGNSTGPGEVSSNSGNTTPGAFHPSSVAPVAAPTDSGVGPGRTPSGLVPTAGVLGGPGVGGSPDAGGGRVGSGGPRGGAVPRGGVLGGPGAAGEPPGGAARSGAPAGNVASAPGRGGGTGMGGVPLGAAGRGRDEDSERKRPAYLEGEDPEELFDTDQLTAPPAIGGDDDE